MNHSELIRIIDYEIVLMNTLTFYSLPECWSPKVLIYWHAAYQQRVWVSAAMMLGVVIPEYSGLCTIEINIPAQSKAYTISIPNNKSAILSYAISSQIYIMIYADDISLWETAVVGLKFRKKIFHCVPCMNHDEIKTVALRFIASIRHSAAEH